MNRFVLGACALLLAWCAGSGVVTAQATDDERPPGMDEDDDGGGGDGEADAPTEPLHILATGGGGIQIRIVNDLTFSQDRFAPSYVDLYGAVVLPGSGMLRHGFGLTFGVNLTGDGPVGAAGVDPFHSPAVGVGYMPYVRFGDDWLLLPRVSVLFGFGFTSLPSGEKTVAKSLGGEISVAGAYLFTAGFGAYGEVGFSGWLGGPNGDSSISFHPVFSGEVGIVIDYEVLP